MRRLLLPLLLLAFTAPASAYEVSLVGGTVVGTAPPGQFNSLDVTKDGDDVYVRDGATEITPGPGCHTREFLRGALCPLSAVTGGVAVDLGDLDDQAFGGNSPVPIAIQGGGGNDRLTGTPFADTLLGGAGRDELFGEAGDDRIDAVDGEDDFVGCGDGAADSVRGEPTDEVVECEARDLGLPGGANATVGVQRGVVVLAGSPGTASDVTVRFAGGEYVLSDPANLAPSAPCRAEGATVRCPRGEGLDVELGDGDDAAHVDGAPGVRLFGAAGDDRLSAANAATVFDGGRGDDTLIGSDGADYLRGGQGADTLRPGYGADDVDTFRAGYESRTAAQGGRDTVDLRDGAPDTYGCDRADTVRGDVFDRFTASCERLVRAADTRPGAAHAVMVARGPFKERDGEIRVPVRCPAAAAGGCTGGITLLGSRQIHGFELRAGQRRILALDRGDLGRSERAVVVTRDAAGRTRTTRVRIRVRPDLVGFG